MLVHAENAISVVDGTLKVMELWKEGMDCLRKYRIKHGYPFKMTKIS